jgi:hypothetical protein
MSATRCRARQIGCGSVGECAAHVSFRARPSSPAGRIRIVAGADSADGSCSLVEAIEEPGSTAPLHVHHGDRPLT